MSIQPFEKNYNPSPRQRVLDRRKPPSFNFNQPYTLSRYEQHPEDVVSSSLSPSRAPRWKPSSPMDSAIDRTRARPSPSLADRRAAKRSKELEKKIMSVMEHVAEDYPEMVRFQEDSGENSTAPGMQTGKYRISLNLDESNIFSFLDEISRMYPELIQMRCNRSAVENEAQSERANEDEEMEMEMETDFSLPKLSI